MHGKVDSETMLRVCFMSVIIRQKSEATMPADPKNFRIQHISIHGDSLALGQLPEPEALDFAARIRALVLPRHPKARILSAAIPGSKLYGLYSRMPLEVVHRVRPENTLISILWCGILDTGTRADGTPVSYVKDFETLWPALLKKIEHAARVVVVGIPPVTKSARHTPWGDSYENSEINNFNEATEWVCQQALVPFVALHDVISSDGPDHQEDGVHLSATGYDKVARAVFRTIATHFS